MLGRRLRRRPTIEPTLDQCLLGLLSGVSANTIHWNIVGLLFNVGPRLRRWTNIKPTLFQCVVFAVWGLSILAQVFVTSQITWIHVNLVRQRNQHAGKRCAALRCATTCLSPWLRVAVLFSSHGTYRCLSKIVFQSQKAVTAYLNSSSYCLLTLCGRIVHLLHWK